MDDKAWVKEFRKKFTVFDGSQNIIKHVTYSSWIEAFISKVREEAYTQGRMDGYKEGMRHSERIKEALSPEREGVEL